MIAFSNVIQILRESNNNTHYSGGCGMPHVWLLPHRPTHSGQYAHDCVFACGVDGHLSLWSSSTRNVGARRVRTASGSRKERGPERSDSSRSTAVTNGRASGSMKVSMVLWLSAVVEDNHEVSNQICSIMMSIGAASISERWRKKTRAAPWQRKVMHAAIAGNSISRETSE